MRPSRWEEEAGRARPLLPPARAGSAVGGSDTNTDTLLHIPSDDATSFLEGLESRSAGFGGFVGFPTALLESVVDEALESDDTIREVKTRLAGSRFVFDDAFIPLSARQRAALYGDEEETGADCTEGGEERRDDDDDDVDDDDDDGEEEEGPFFRGDVSLADVVDFHGRPGVKNPLGGSVSVTLSGLMKPIAIRVDDDAMSAGLEVCPSRPRTRIMC